MKEQCSISKEKLASLEDGLSQCEEGCESTTKGGGCEQLIQCVKLILYVGLVLFVGLACYSLWQTYLFRSVEVKVTDISPQSEQKSFVNQKSDQQWNSITSKEFHRCGDLLKTLGKILHAENVLSSEIRRDDEMGSIEAVISSSSTQNPDSEINWTRDASSSADSDIESMLHHFQISSVSTTDAGIENTFHESLESDEAKGDTSNVPTSTESFAASAREANDAEVSPDVGSQTVPFFFLNQGKPYQCTCKMQHGVGVSKCVSLLNHDDSQSNDWWDDVEDNYYDDALRDDVPHSSLATESSEWVKKIDSEEQQSKEPMNYVFVQWTIEDPRNEEMPFVDQSDLRDDSESKPAEEETFPAEGHNLLTLLLQDSLINVDKSSELISESSTEDEEVDPIAESDSSNESVPLIHVPLSPAVQESAEEIINSDASPRFKSDPFEIVAGEGHNLLTLLLLDSLKNNDDQSSEEKSQSNAEDEELEHLAENDSSEGLVTSPEATWSQSFHGSPEERVSSDESAYSFDSSNWNTDLTEPKFPCSISSAMTEDYSEKIRDILFGVNPDERSFDALIEGQLNRCTIDSGLTCVPLPALSDDQNEWVDWSDNVEDYYNDAPRDELDSSSTTDSWTEVRDSPWTEEKLDSIQNPSRENTDVDQSVPERTSKLKPEGEEIRDSLESEETPQSLTVYRFIVEEEIAAYMRKNYTRKDIQIFINYWHDYINKNLKACMDITLKMEFALRNDFMLKCQETILSIVTSKTC